MKIKDIIYQIKNINFDETLEYLVKKAKNRNGKTFVVTINPEIVMLANNDREYEKVLKSTDLALADGVGIIWAGKIFGKNLNGRIHGVDLVEKLSETVAKKPIKVGFLGGNKNVAQKTADCLSRKYPGLNVAFAINEWPEELDDRGLKVEDRALKAENRRLPAYPQSSITKNPSSLIHNQSSREKMSTDILFVAFGSPKQEKWIYDHLDKIDAKVAIGVGGAFDFISGKVLRAPKWVRKIGLEWLFRLIIQPWRIKRQTALARFVLLVLRERFL